MKEAIKLEYTLNSSPKIIFPRISTPGGLAEWFADDVRLDSFNNDVYVFVWNDSEQKAKVVQSKDNQYMRFQWLDDDDEGYFEFRINIDELTNDVALIVVDHVDPDEKDDAIELWNTQIDELKRAIGL